ncbi:MAG: hypothetical protein JJE04_09085 [Acidobacteriia bacterium]|nr:hypothetical protein [Terriglobia bacterium]
MGGHFGSREQQIHLTILVFFPGVLFWINPNWPFQGLGHMDNWYYFGHFIHFPRYQHLVQNYQGERLPWLLPGRFLTWLLSPPYGGLALTLLTTSLALVCLYLLVKRFSDARTALLAAFLMGGHPCFIGANGWNYFSGGSIAYMLLAYLLIVRSHSSSYPRLMMVLAGFVWGGLIYMYIAWLIFTPVCLLMYLAGRDPSQKVLSRAGLAQVVRAAGWLGIGFGMMTALMALLYRAIVGVPGFFFEKNVAAARQVATFVENPYSTGNFQWISSGAWVVFPVLALSVSLAAVFQYRRLMDWLPFPVLLMVASYIYSASIMILMTIRQSRLLEFEYFAAILMPTLYGSLALLALKVPPKVRLLHWLAVLLASTVITSGALWGPYLYEKSLGQGMLYPYLLGLAGIAVWLVWPGRRFSWTLVCLLLAASGFGLVPGFTVMAYRAQFNGLGAYSRVAQQVQVVDEHFTSRSHSADARYPKFWINNYDHANTSEYRAVMCAFSAHGFSMYTYPNVEKGRVYKPGSELVLITPSKDVFDDANQKMTAAGMPLALVGQDFVDDPDHPNWITYVRILPPTAPH